MASEGKAGMTNISGNVVEIYIPRRCSWTNRLITAKDHASVQVNICELTSEGIMNHTGQVTYDICGFVRDMGRSDMAICYLAHQAGILPREM